MSTFVHRCLLSTLCVSCSPSLALAGSCLGTAIKQVDGARGGSVCLATGAAVQCWWTGAASCVNTPDTGQCIRAWCPLWINMSFAYAGARCVIKDGYIGEEECRVVGRLWLYVSQFRIFCAQPQRWEFYDIVAYYQERTSCKSCITNTLHEHLQTVLRGDKLFSTFRFQTQ